MAKAGYLAQNTSAWTINGPSSPASNISSTTFATPTLTVNFAAISGWTPAAGQRAWITGQTSATGNNGDFLVATAPTSTSITVANQLGAANATAQGTIVLSAPQTILAVTAPTSFGWDLKKVELSFTGVSSSTGPYLCELVTHTALAGGTNITNPASTIQQVYGPTITAGFTVTGPYTVEPTSAATVLDSWLVTPNQTTLIYDWPLGTSYDGPASGTIALRITPFGVSTSAQVRASMLVERC